MSVRGDEMINMIEFLEILDRHRSDNKKTVYGGSVLVLYSENGEYKSTEFVNICQDMNWLELYRLLYDKFESQVICAMVEELINGKGSQIFYTSGDDIFRIQSEKDTKVIRFPTGDNNE